MANSEFMKPRRRLRRMRRRNDRRARRGVREEVRRTDRIPAGAPMAAHDEPAGYTTDAAVYSTGDGDAPMYHFHRQLTYRDEYDPQSVTETPGA